MSFSAPKPPDPVATANAQQGYNLTAATNQNKLNSYSQSNPYSTMSYVADPSSPSGYRIDTALSAPQQSLLNTQTSNQGRAGGEVGSYLSNASNFANTAGKLGQNTAGMYSNAPNIQALDPTSLVKTLNNWSATYQQPIFDQQSSNLEAQLRNQGLQPGTEAYNNAKNLLARNQGDQITQFLTANIGQGQAAQAQKFGQDVTNYELPLQTESSLLGNATAANQNAGALASYAAPQGGTFQQAPNASIQPANYQGAVESNYQGQVANNNAMWNGIGQLGSAAVGAAFAPLTGGASLAGMFARGPSGGWGNLGFGGGSPSGYGR